MKKIFIKRLNIKKSEPPIPGTESRYKNKILSFIKSKAERPLFSKKSLSPDVSKVTKKNDSNYIEKDLARYFTLTNNHLPRNRLASTRNQTANNTQNTSEREKRYDANTNQEQSVNNELTRTPVRSAPLSTQDGNESESDTEWLSAKDGYESEPDTDWLTAYNASDIESDLENFDIDNDIDVMSDDDIFAPSATPSNGIDGNDITPDHFREAMKKMIEEEKKLEFQRKNRDIILKYRSKDDLALLPASQIKNIRNSSSLDNQSIYQHPNLVALRKTDIDLERYSIDFLQSEGLFQALHKRQYLLRNNSESDTYKNEVKELVNQLNKKHIQGLPLELDIDLSRKEDLAPVLNKIIKKLSTLLTDKQIELLKEAVKALEKNQSSQEKNSQINHIITLLDETKSALKTHKAVNNIEDILNTVSMLKEHLSLDILKTSKAEIKKAIMNQFKHLNLPGGENYSRGITIIDLPTGTPVTVSLGVEHLQSFRTENYLTILEHRETKGSLMVNVGLPRKAGLDGVVRPSINSIRTHRNLEQLVDDHADRIMSLILKAPIKTLYSSEKSSIKPLKNGGELYQLYQIVKKQNLIQNQRSLLNDNLHRLGILNENEELELAEGHRKNLPQKRRRYAVEFLGNANGKLAPTIISMADGIERKYEWTNEYDREPLYTSLLKRADLLNHKFREIGSLSIKNINKDAIKIGINSTIGHPLQGQNDLSKMTTVSLSHAALNISQHRKNIKKSIFSNFQVLQKYTDYVQRSDLTYTRESSKLEEKILSKMKIRERNEEFKNKIYIEKNLGTRGRRNTIEKLIVNHAALVKLYNDTFSHYSLKPRQGTKEAVNESQFTDALKIIDKKFQSPNLTLDNRDLDKLHSLSRVKVNKFTTRGKFSSQILGVTVDIIGEHSKIRHVDPVKTGIEYKLTTILSGNISRGSIEAIITTINKNMSQEAGEDATTETAETIEKALSYQINAGITGKTKLDISIWNKRLDFIRVSGIAEVGIKQALTKVIGGAASTIAEEAISGTALITTGEVNNLQEWIGTNSLHYLHLQYNGLLSAGSIDPTGSENNSWEETFNKYTTQHSRLIEKMSQPNSRINAYINSLINNGSDYYTPDELSQIQQAASSLIDYSKDYSAQKNSFNQEKNQQLIKNIIKELNNIFYIYNKSIISGKKNKHKEDIFKKPILL